MLEKIAELNSVLTNYRNNGHSEEVLKFYEEVLDAMTFTMGKTDMFYFRETAELIDCKAIEAASLLDTTYRIRFALSKTHLLH